MVQCRERGEVEVSALESEFVDVAVRLRVGLREADRPDLGVEAVGERVPHGMHAPARTGARLEDDHFVSGPFELEGGGESRQAGADDENATLPRVRPAGRQGTGRHVASRGIGDEPSERLSEKWSEAEGSEVAHERTSRGVMHEGLLRSSGWNPSRSCAARAAKASRLAAPPSQSGPGPAYRHAEFVGPVSR